MQTLTWQIDKKISVSITRPYQFHPVSASILDYVLCNKGDQDKH